MEDTSIETDVRTRLNLLGSVINSTVQTGLSEGLFKPDEFAFKKIRLDGFGYTELGITYTRKSVLPTSKIEWEPVIESIVQDITKTQEYKSILDLLSQTTGEVGSSKLILLNFTTLFTLNCLIESNEQKRQEYLETLFAKVLKHVNNDNYTIKIVAQLGGIIILSEPIRLLTSYTEIELRQPTREDCERELHWTQVNNFNTQPSAILTLQFQASSIAEFSSIGTRMQQAITILRLFDLGGVELFWPEMTTESLLDILPLDIPPVTARSASQERYVIDPTQVERLIFFWHRLAKILPPEGYGSEAEVISPINIAFQRYSEALLTDSPVVERRIANVMMGLESLYLRSESSEITYRLRMRVAKVLGLLGEDPYKVKEAVNDAYNVRSAFTHGDSIPKETKKQIDKTYSGLHGLLNEVLKQLRISIVFFIVSQKQYDKSQKQYDKQSLVKLMEDAVIDNLKETELRQLAESSKDLLTR